MFFLFYFFFTYFSHFCFQGWRDFQGIKKIKTTKHPSLCMLCFDDPAIALSKCVFSTPGWNPANIHVRIKNSHGKEKCPDLFETTTSPSALNAIGAKSTSGNTTSERSTITSSTMDRFVQTHSSPAASRKDLDRIIYQFCNKTGIAKRHAASDYMHEMLSYAVDHAAFLRKTTAPFKLGKYKYKQVQIESFATSMNILSKLVEITRNWFREKTKHPRLPFLFVSHDCWDSENNDILGVSVFLIVPQLWRMVSVPIGFRRSTGKKATDIVEQCLVAMKR